MNASEKALQGKHTATAKALYMAFELSDTKWILCLSDGVRRASQYTVGAGDQVGVLSCIAPRRKLAARLGVDCTTKPLRMHKQSWFAAPWERYST